MLEQASPRGPVEGLLCLVGLCCKMRSGLTGVPAERTSQPRADITSCVKGRD